MTWNKNPGFNYIIIMWGKIAVILIFTGTIMTVVGYYEDQKKNWEHTKIIYKFLNETIPESHLKDQEDVYNTYSRMFTNKSLL